MPTRVHPNVVARVLAGTQEALEKEDGDDAGQKRGELDHLGRDHAAHPAQAGERDRHAAHEHDAPVDRPARDHGQRHRRRVDHDPEVEQAQQDEEDARAAAQRDVEAALEVLVPRSDREAMVERQDHAVDDRDRERRGEHAEHQGQVLREDECRAPHERDPKYLGTQDYPIV